MSASTATTTAAGSMWELLYKAVLVAMIMTVFLIVVVAWTGAGSGSRHVGRSWFREDGGSSCTPTPARRAQLPRTGQAPYITSFFTGYKGGRMPQAKIFCLVIGAEGTGSTWVSNEVPADYRLPSDPKKGFTATLHQLWSSGPLQQRMDAQKRLVHDLKHLIPRGPGRGHRLFVLHVSAPDWDADHYPDLHSSLWSSFFEAHYTLRVIVLYRDPTQAAYSNYRRAWPHLRDTATGRPDLLRSARSTERHMSLLSEQIRCLQHPHDVLVLGYQRLLLQPEVEADRISKYLWLYPETAQDFVARFKASRRAPRSFTDRPSDTDRRFLQQFFDTERCGKWAYLRERALAGFSLNDRSHPFQQDAASLFPTQNTTTTTTKEKHE